MGLGCETRRLVCLRLQGVAIPTDQQEPHNGFAQSSDGETQALVRMYRICRCTGGGFETPSGVDFERAELAFLPRIGPQGRGSPNLDLQSAASHSPKFRLAGGNSPGQARPLGRLSQKCQDSQE